MDKIEWIIVNDVLKKTFLTSIITTKIYLHK